MRALVFEDGSLRLQAHRPPPQPGAGEALIRPLLAGICATDIEICRGYMGFNGALGHEFVGVVEAVYDTQDAAATALLGQRVVGSINCVCGRCDMCLGGLAAHCRNRTVLGISGRDGCFADSFALPIRNLLLVPGVIDNDRAVFTEPLAAACQVLRQIRIQSDGLVTVLGDGRLGLLVAQVLRRRHERVRVIGKHPQKLALCEKWGVRHRLLSDTPPRADQDIVIDCTGSAEGLSLALKMVRPRGQVVLKTTVAHQTAADLAQLVINEVQLTGSRCGPFSDALALLLEEHVDVVSLISRRMKIADGVNAMRIAQQPDVLKVLLEFD